MKYALYFLTMALLFAGGVLVGHAYLPDHSTVQAAAVSVPPLKTDNPIFQRTTREGAQRELEILDMALQSCPVVVNEEKDRIVNHIKLWLALEDFELKKSTLELEMAKNVETNRPTAQLVRAVEDYNTAREYAEKLADELFPPRANNLLATTPQVPAETAPSTHTVSQTSL